MILGSWLLVLSACNTRKKHTYFVIKDKNNREVFRLDDTLDLQLTGSGHSEVPDSVQWFLGDSLLAVNKQELRLEARSLGLGVKKLSIKAWKDDRDFLNKMDPVILSDTAPERYGHTVVRTYPHDTSAYTQGLFFSAGRLYEGTGRTGESVLRMTGLQGNVLKKIPLPDDIFGEGISELGDKIYQLTYRSNKGFIYRKTNLEKIAEFTYPEAFEGWGLTTDGRYLIASDGSNRLRFLDPEQDMKVVRTVEVFDDKEAIKHLNELEYVNGVLYANVYTKDYILGIDPESGKVLRRIDFSGLYPEEEYYKGFDKYNYVLNGIAYNPENDHFYITGKKWAKLFEVALVPEDSAAK